MSVSALTGFDFGRLVDAGLMADKAAENAWHKPDGRWHASSLGDCPRAQILKRAGIDEGQTRSSLLTFALGPAVHDSVERWAESYAAVEPRFEVLYTEVGWVHPTLNLKAKPDLVGAWEGAPFVLEIKTERGGCPICKRGGADYWRQKRSAEFGYPTPVDYNHWLQATASAMCAEQSTGPIAQGRVLYVTKNDWFLDAVPVSLDDPIMRAEVVRRVETLDKLWAEYQARGALPPRIDPGDKDMIWRCDLRRKDELDGGKGRWCTVREACMGAPV
jgi:hypothetical protein